MCIAAGQFDPTDPNKPLYRCDIYQSTDAGDIMEYLRYRSYLKMMTFILLISLFDVRYRELLKAGLSKPWRDTLLNAIGVSELDASAVIDYFAPLSDYIDKQLAENNETQFIGWKSTYKTMYNESNRPIPVSDNTVPIIVGCVLAGLVVIVIIAYFVGRSRNRKKHSKNLHGHENPSAITLE